MVSKFKINRIIKKKSSESCDIVFLGDTSFGENYQMRYDNNILTTKGYHYPLEKMSDFLHDADLVIANLDTPLTDIQTSPYEGEKQHLHWSDINKAPKIFLRHHIDTMSLANNHVYDYGKKGFYQTLETLEKNDIAYFGAGRNETEACTPFIIEIQQHNNAFQIAIISCFEERPVYQEKYGIYAADKKPGVNRLNIATIEKTIKQLKDQNPDIFIILVPHWGLSYELCTND